MSCTVHDIVLAGKLMSGFRLSSFTVNTSSQWQVGMNSACVVLGSFTTRAAKVHVLKTLGGLSLLVVLKEVFESELPLQLLRVRRRHVGLGQSRCARRSDCTDSRITRCHKVSYLHKEMMRAAHY